MPIRTEDRPEVDLPDTDRYTYDDYQQLSEGAPYELIHGHLDAFDKKQLYETHDVREYWIVAPNTETVEVYRNTDEGFCQHARAAEEGRVASALLDDFAGSLGDLF